MNRNLEALLRWGVENTPRPEGGQHDQSTAIAPSNAPSLSPSTGAVLPSASASSNVATGSSGSTSNSNNNNNKLDPAVLDALMGKSDGQRMMECVMDLKSEGKYSKEQKLYIWDELELLVENMDNANDLENMKLWQPIADFLEDPDEDMRLQCCWVLGTAVQNNPKSQTALLALDSLPKLIELLQSDPSSELRSKAIYTISGLLRHNSSALTRFTELNGWGALASALKDPSISLRRKTAFLVHSLFINSASTEDAMSYNEAAQKAGIHSTLLDSLSKKTALPIGENGEIEDIDVDYSDKAVNALVSITDKAGEGKVDRVFTAPQKTQLKSLLEELEKEDRIPTDLSKEEWNSFADAVKKAW